MRKPALQSNCLVSANELWTQPDSRCLPLDLHVWNCGFAALESWQGLLTVLWDRGLSTGLQIQSQVGPGLGGRCQASYDKCGHFKNGAGHFYCESQSSELCEQVLKIIITILASKQLCVILVGLRATLEYAPLMTDHLTP